MHDEKALNKLEESAYKELDKIVEKELTPQSLSLAKELLCVLKEIPEIKSMHHMDDGMMESSYGGHPRYYDIAAYDGYSYDNGMSERRGAESYDWTLCKSRRWADVRHISDGYEREQSGPARYDEHDEPDDGTSRSHGKEQVVDLEGALLGALFSYGESSWKTTNYTISVFMV